MIIQQRTIMQLRSDPAGDGSWQASRDGGKRRHNGIDLVCQPGGILISPLYGEVTKLGYAYGEDLFWRYIEITDRDRLKHRFFYANPIVKAGEIVTPLSSIGEMQNITLKYPNTGMTPHIHYGVKDQTGKYIKPEVTFA